MKYDDLDKTKDLFDFTPEVPTPIENIEMEGASKEYLTDDLGLTPLNEEDKTPKVTNEHKPSKKKSSLKNKWNSLDKKKKIIIIASSVIILILIIVLVLVLVLKKDDEKPTTNDTPKAPEVIIEKDNYIYKDGILTFIDDGENEIGTYTCKNSNEKLCYVVDYSDEDDFDTVKNVYENGSLITRRSKIYFNKYVFIYDNSKEKDGSIILYNIESKKTEGAYTLVKGFNDSNFVILRNDKNKYGLVEITEDEIKDKIDFSFDYLGMINKDANLVAKTSNKYYIYNKDGKALSKSSSYPIKSYNNERFVNSDEGKYQAYDFKGNSLFSDTYDFIELRSNFAVLIKDNKLYIRDYNDNKYMENGITLGNNNYNTLNVYNEDKEKIETREAYNITVNEGIITINYKIKNKEKTVTVDMQEKDLNKDLKYANYLDGKIYFYKDEDKNELLGSYSCINKNENELNHCYVARDSFYSKNGIETDHSSDIGVIPIFNERYVFIMDSLDPTNNPNIVLYDLKTNRTLSKYLNVDTGSYTKEENLTFKEADQIYVMAKSKSSNNYGLIRIGKEDVKGVIGFKYASIEKLRDYIMVKDSASTYSLFDYTGREITGKYGYRIVDYKNEYLKVTDNSSFYVYDFKGNKLEDMKYDYIALEDDYYVVINAGGLDIHKYTDQTFKLSETIPVESDNSYQISTTEYSYIIKVKNTTYEFSKLDGSNVKENNNNEENNEES